MKNVKLGLFALLGLVGAASAFTNVPKHFNGTTYYAISDGSGSFTWQKSKPAGFACQTKLTQVCTIVTINGFTPVNGQVPNSSQATLLNTDKVYREL
jgi:hypothetical protein